MPTTATTTCPADLMRHNQRLSYEELRREANDAFDASSKTQRQLCAEVYKKTKEGKHGNGAVKQVLREKWIDNCVNNFSKEFVEEIHRREGLS